MILQYRTFSECGPRYKNEDAMGCVLIPEQQRAMFVLCDGMGGHRSGDIASQTVVKSLGNYWRRNPTCEDCNEKIIDACNEAKGILEKCPQVEMGTTMVMVCLEMAEPSSLIVETADAIISIHGDCSIGIQPTIAQQLLKVGNMFIKVSCREKKLIYLKSMNMSSPQETICCFVAMAYIKASTIMKK